MSTYYATTTQNEKLFGLSILAVADSPDAALTAGRAAISKRYTDGRSKFADTERKNLRVQSAEVLLKHVGAEEFESMISAWELSSIKRGEIS